jgi:hypothetical protein
VEMSKQTALCGDEQVLCRDEQVLCGDERCVEMSKHRAEQGFLNCQLKLACSNNVRESCVVLGMCETKLKGMTYKHLLPRSGLYT